MTDAIDSIASIVQSFQSSERSLLPSDDASAEIEEEFIIMSNKGGTIP